MTPRQFLTALWEAAVDAVDPERLVSDALGRRGDAVYFRSGLREFVFVPGRVALLSLGKASFGMARAAARTLGGRVDSALVIGPSGASREEIPENWRVIESAHPVPDGRSLAAGDAALALASSVREGDLLLVLLSGGGSSLATALSEGVSLSDKSRVISLLMAAGAPIEEINLVRGALSRMKAGRLAAAAGGANVATLVLSDVGDAGWHLVASGPTLGIPPSPRDALFVLDRYRLAPLVPPAIRRFLISSPQEPPVSPGSGRWSVLLGDVRTAMEGANLAARRLGADVRLVPELLTGEARSTARRLAVAGACAGNLVRRAGVPARRLVTVFGGETTVTVKGAGRGGRNRELALATALELQRARGATALVAGTDGVDNLPDAAGAFVDDTTVARARLRGLDPMAALAANDSGSFFNALGDAFCPGPTGTNVGDLAFVLAPGSEGEPSPAAEEDWEIPLPSLS